MEQKKGGIMKIWILLFIILAVIYDYRDFQIPNWLNGIGDSENAYQPGTVF